MEPPKNEKMQPVQSKTMPLSQNPLAKAMQKRPKKQTQSSETWADEKIQSVSQQIREQSLADHDKRRQDMQRQLVEAEAQLVVMKDLLVKREELLKETNEDTENQMLDEDGNLVLKDNETGEKKVLTEENKKEPSKKITKKRIQEMKEKLRLMNAQTECYLADIENTMQYLGSLEEASERAGPMSKEMEKLLSEADGEDDFINQVYNENRQPRIPTNKKSGAAQVQKSPVVERTTDSRASVAEEGDSQDSEIDEEQKEEEQASNAEYDEDDRKFFITDRDGDTVLDYDEAKASYDESEDLKQS